MRKNYFGSVAATNYIINFLFSSFFVISTYFLFMISNHVCNFFLPTLKYSFSDQGENKETEVFGFHKEKGFKF